MADRPNLRNFNGGLRPTLSLGAQPNSPHVNPNAGDISSGMEALSRGLGSAAETLQRIQKQRAAFAEEYTKEQFLLDRQNLKDHQQVMDSAEGADRFMLLGQGTVIQRVLDERRGAALYPEVLSHAEEHIKLLGEEDPEIVKDPERVRTELLGLIDPYIKDESDDFARGLAAALDEPFDTLVIGTVRGYDERRGKEVSAALTGDTTAQLKTVTSLDEFLNFWETTQIAGETFRLDKTEEQNAMVGAVRAALLDPTFKNEGVLRQITTHLLSEKGGLSEDNLLALRGSFNSHLNDRAGGDAAQRAAEKAANDKREAEAWVRLRNLAAADPEGWATKPEALEAANVIDTLNGASGSDGAIGILTSQLRTRETVTESPFWAGHVRESAANGILTPSDITALNRAGFIGRETADAAMKSLANAGTTNSLARNATYKQYLGMFVNERGFLSASKAAQQRIFQTLMHQAAIADPTLLSANPDDAGRLLVAIDKAYKQVTSLNSSAIDLSADTEEKVQKFIDPVLKGMLNYDPDKRANSIAQIDRAVSTGQIRRIPDGRLKNWIIHTMSRNLDPMDALWRFDPTPGYAHPGDVPPNEPLMDGGDIPIF